MAAPLRVNRERSEGGQATVEFALLAPLLLLLLLGIVQFGQVLGTYMTVVEVARVGARAAALGSDALQAEEQAAAAGATSGLLSADLTVTVTGTAGSGTSWESGTSVSCAAKYALPVVVPLFWPVLGSTFNVSNTVVMMAEGG